MQTNGTATNFLTVGIIGLMLLGGLGLTTTAGCGGAITGSQINQLSCPVTTVSATMPLLQQNHEAVLPSVDDLFVVVVVLFLASFTVPKVINGPAMRYRRRFLHALLPRYGPQNQIGRHCFVVPKRDP